MKKEKIIKVAVIVVVAIVSIWLLWTFGKKLRDIIASKKNAKTLDKSIDVKELTYDDAQYKSFAETLYNAMKGAGTDEKKIQEVFNQMQTRSDVLKLSSVFGVKDGETLDEWLDGDLSSSEKDEYVNKVLEAKAINYVF